MADEVVAEAAETEEIAEETQAEEPQAEAEKPKPGAQSAAENKFAFELRQAKKLAEDLKRENEGYKRRDDDKRKEQLTEQQRLQEERDNLARENESLRLDNMRARIGAEFKLPATLVARLQGTDEEAMRADAEDLAKFAPRSRVGAVTDPARGGGAQRIYTRAELQADPALARSPEVRQAHAEGRVRQ